MSSNANLELLPGEEVVFEGGTGVLTNRRLFARVKRRRGESPDKIAPLSDVTEYKRVIGGQDSRIRQGLMLLAGGAALTLLELTMSSTLRESGRIFELLDVLLFMLGACGLVLGLYLVLRSLVRVKPHTTVFFRMSNGEDVPVSFPGRENPQADELIRRYSRAKSGLGVSPRPPSEPSARQDS